MLYQQTAVSKVTLIIFRAYEFEEKRSEASVKAKTAATANKTWILWLRSWQWLGLHSKHEFLKDFFRHKHIIINFVIILFFY